MVGRRWWATVAAQWGAAGTLVLFVLLIESKPLASIGWTSPTAWDVKAAVLALIAGLVGFSVIAAGFGQVNSTITTTVRARGPGVLAVLAITAGFTEEVVFRGFCIERLGDVIHSYAWAGMFMLLAFVLSHVRLWGRRTALAVAAPGAALTWLYVDTRNLPACIAAHAANDLWAFIVAPRLAARVTRSRTRPSGM